MMLMTEVVASTHMSGCPSDPGALARRRCYYKCPRPPAVTTSQVALTAETSSATVGMVPGVTHGGPDTLGYSKGKKSLTPFSPLSLSQLMANLTYFPGTIFHRYCRS